MSVQTEIDRIITAVTNAHMKVLAKGGTTAEPYLVANLEGAIDTIPKANTPAVVEEKDVNFWDYDGTLLYSYTLKEAQALTELPSGPDWHEYLIFNSWNWTISEVAAIDAPADIGALYNTEDEATFIYLDIIEPLNSTVVLNVSGNPDIEWGDGDSDAAASTGISHTFGVTGRFVIKIIGSHTIGGGTAAPLVSTGFQNVTSVLVDLNRSCAPYCCQDFNSLVKTTISRNIKGALKNCRRLKFYVLSVNHIDVEQFYSCQSLRLISFPAAPNLIQSQGVRGCASLQRINNKHTLTSDGYIMMSCYSIDEIHIRNAAAAYCAHSCYSARKIVVHEGVTTIGVLAFYNCISAEFVSIASTVTSIGAQAFYNNTKVKRLVFLPETPPTVADANAFYGISSDCVVQVPAASLTTYQEATNYSGIAARMVGV